MTSQDSQPLAARARREERFSGAPIGVLLLDEIAPFIPGSMGHAGTFSLPTRYRTMPGVTVEKVLGPDAAKCESVVVDSALTLAAEGARMITANCGFTARYQRAVRDAVDVPVLLSSLLLAPFLETMLPRTKTLGVLTASARSLSPEFLSAVDLARYADRFAVAGLDESPAFNAAFVANTGEADFAAIADEVIDTAEALIRRRPDVGCLLLECSELPPYAAAVQSAIGIPVFDFTSMVEFFAAGLRRSSFQGFI